MVAYTSPDCLPYFEGTDSPCLNTGTVCEPSTLWCDFARLVEARLDEFDAVADSTLTSPPMAWIETTTATVYTIGGPEVTVPFTTVVVDTNNMVSLDTNNSVITIQTDGLYNVFGYAFGVTNSSGSNADGILDIDFIPASSVYPNGVNSVFVSRGTQVQDTAQALNLNFTVPLFAGQKVTTTLSGGGIANDTITYSQISVGVAWMGGLP